MVLASPSLAKSSRCLINSQLVRLPPLRSLRMRTSTQLPCSLSPCNVNFRSPFLNPPPPRGRIPRSRVPSAGRSRRHTVPPEWYLRNRRNPADDLPPPPPAACH